MRGKLELPRLWESEKYISWPHSHANPIVRIPRPKGTPESKSIKRLPGESERDIFDRCFAYRDRRGPDVWGEKRWAELLKFPKRSVAKHRQQPAGPITGVNHEERPNGTTVWTALWYEPRPDGTRRRRSKQFSYGTLLSRYATSEQAMAAAVEKRQDEEARWYSTTGIREQRQVSRLDAES